VKSKVEKLETRGEEGSSRPQKQSLSISRINPLPENSIMELTNEQKLANAKAAKVHGNRVFIMKREDETMTEGGIILSETTAKTFAVYTVINSNVEAFEAKDEVVCLGMGPQELPEEIFGERMFCIEAEDILATVPPTLKELCEPLAPGDDSVDPKVPNMDPECQAVTDQQEGGTELHCPEKGGE
jgi:co-chaperonin GroES (HSP10)